MAMDQPLARPSDKRYVAWVDVVAFVPNGQEQTVVVDVKTVNGLRTGGHFVPVGLEPILVDFMGGDAVYARTHPPTDGAAPPAAEPPVADKAPVEVLLMTADGRLLAHNSAQDEVDPERVKRLEERSANGFEQGEDTCRAAGIWTTRSTINRSREPPGRRAYAPLLVA